MTQPHPDFLAIKATSGALIDACGKSEACGVILNKSASLIRSYANPNVPDRFMPLDDLIVLERHAQRPIVCAWGVERHRADPDRVRRASSPADLAALAKENADVLGAMATAWADGKLCLADRQRIARELRESIAAQYEMLEALEGGL